MSKVIKGGNWADNIKAKIKKYTEKIKRSKPGDNTEVYKEKLAYYKRMTTMRGGQITDDIQADLNRMPELNYDPEEIQKLQDAFDNDNFDALATTILTTAKNDGLFQSYKIDKAPEDVGPVISNEAEYNAFASKLETYKASLSNLIASLNDYPAEKTKIINSIIGDLQTVNENITRKDSIIEDVIGTISDAQIQLSNVDRLVGDIDVESIRTGLKDTNTAANKNIKNYTAMMQVYDYLLKLKTGTAAPADDNQARAAVDIIRESDSDRLKTILTNIETFNVPDNYATTLSQFLEYINAAVNGNTANPEESIVVEEPVDEANA